VNVDRIDPFPIERGKHFGFPTVLTEQKKENQMKKTVRLLSGFLLMAGAAQAAVITNLDSTPTDYLADAYNAVGSTATYAVSTTITSGQSFTHTTANGKDWLFSSITFKSYTAAGTTNTPASDFTLSIYDGESLDAADLLGSFTFDAGTFDTTQNAIITFGLTDAESATLGALTSGATYTVVLSSTGASMDLMRDKIANYDGGQGVYNSGFISGNDATFWVAEAIPEPATISMIGIGALVPFLIRRKNCK
jgi:hypothetical protein